MQALKQYPGTLLFVSHDHQFVQELATDVLELTPKGLFYFPGDYEQFLASKKSSASGPSQMQDSIVPESHVQSAGAKEKKKQLNALERQIQKQEHEIKKKCEKLEKASFGFDKYNALLVDIKSLQAELDGYMYEWEQLSNF